MSKYTDIYPWSRKEAQRNGEDGDWIISFSENCACARAIEQAIKTNYSKNSLNGECAKGVIEQYGFDRVNWVLANTIQNGEHDGRYSKENKEWAENFFIPKEKRNLQYRFAVGSHEELCLNLGGCYIDFLSGEFKINPLEPKAWSDTTEDTDEDSPDAFKKVTRLSQHIAFLKDFFRCYKDFDDTQIDTIEILLAKLYARFGITDTTDYTVMKATDYPTMEDFYKLCEEEYMTYDKTRKYLYTEETLQVVCLGINSMCVGSESKYFNGHTNVSDGDFLCFGVKGLMDTNKLLKDAMVFNILSYMSNQLLGVGNTAASIDELYLFLSNMTAIEYIRNAMKRVRKKESSVILATVSITLDKTKPTGTLYGGTSVVASGSSTNAAYIKFVPSDNIALSATYVKLPGASSYTAYTSGTQYTAEGEYSFYTIDRANNQSVIYTVKLDRQIPAAQLYVDEKPLNNGGYTNGDHIKFESDSAKCYVKLPDSDTFVEYLSGAEYYKAGKYTFYGVSESGTSTGYYTVIIDRTIKTVDVQNVTDGVTNGDVVITWTDGDANLYAPIKSVTINGKAYTKGQTVYTIDTATYTVEVVDAGGNKWTTEFRSTKKNVLTDTLQKEYYEIYDVNGDYFAFTTYENALAFATAREKSLVTTGAWNSDSWDAGIAMDEKDSANAVNGQYFVYKKSGSPDELVAYFTEERLNEVIAEYAKVGIVDYFYWEKNPATAGEGENLYSYSTDKNILASSVTLGENIAVLIDGEEFIGSVYDVEGKALLTVCDDWGNTCDYNITVIRNAPEILYAVGEGNTNPVVYERTYYLKDKVTVSITDSFDEWAMFSVYDENGDLLGNFNLTDTYAITESGSYTVVAVNHYGESETFNLVISLDAPKVSVTENAEEKKLDVVITKSADDESHIQSLVIVKSTDGGETWVEVDKDDYGTPVTTDTLAYSFRTSAIYKVSVTDEFRTGIDTITAQLDYVQKNPEGTLVGVDNNGYTNGTVTFDWTDEATVVLTKDGIVVPYESGDELTEDGAYTLTFENYDGYKATYAFTIDTKAPEIKTEGADHRESVNEDVKVFYTEENLTAELFKDGKFLGEYTSGNPVSADGQYRIRVSDQANNVVEVEFTIDKTVDYAINVNDKGLSNSVIATANELVTVSLTKNGEAVEYALGAAITEPADYVLVLTDALGNRSEVAFKVVEPLVKEFTHNFDEVEGFGGVTVNGEDKRLNYGTLELKEDGVYEVGVIVGGNTYLFTVEVDGTAPTVTLNGVENGGETKDAVTVTAPSETATVKVIKDGEEIKYTIGDEITEAGAYRIIVEDEIGNSTEYSFEIVEGISGWVIFLIVLGSLLLVGGIVVFILKKKEII